jgi:carbon starvation protein CstA
MTFYGGIRELNDIMTANDGNAAVVVNEISNSLLGRFGGILALLGVVAAPITSGDTAFRSARLIVSDFMKVRQGPIRNRLMISIPLFITGYLLTRIDFSIIWRYFAWSNQTLATVVLWAITIYLTKNRKPVWITLIPALFMTVVITSYILLAPEGFGLSKLISYSAGALCSTVCLVTYLFYRRRV